MAWEMRGSCGPYYTRSTRVGGRVIREYVGTGPLAEAIAIVDTIGRRRRNEEREAWRREREAIRANDHLVADAGEAVLTLTRGWLLAQGYHTHHGTWRRKRE